jgi:hypothetical protein
MTKEESIIVAAGSITGGLIACRHVFSPPAAISLYREILGALIAAESDAAAPNVPADGE